MTTSPAPLAPKPRKTPEAKRKQAARALLGDEADAITPRDLPPPLPKDLKGYGELRFLVETYYACQDHRIKAGNRLGALQRTIGIEEERAKQLHAYVDARMEGMETELKAAIRKLIKTEPLWHEWLVNVRGVGECIAGGLVAWVGGAHYQALTAEEARAAKARGEAVVERILDGEDPEDPEALKGLYRVQPGIAAFPTISKFWTYCGLGLRPDGTIQRRAKGEQGNWNPRLKVLFWKAAASFVRSGAGGYRQLYEQTKARLLARAPEWVSLDSPQESKMMGRLVHVVRYADGRQQEHPIEKLPMLTKALLTKLRREGSGKVLLGWRPAHVDAQARRWVAKLFAAHVWTKWRQLLGLPADLPWVIEKGGHKTYIPVVEE